jgi:hypothetical protein
VTGGPRIGRRGLLGALAAGLALAAAALPGGLAPLRWLARRIGGRGARAELRALLLAHFPYLRIDAEVADAWLRDLERRGGGLPDPAALPSDLALRFLLSTDFFQGGADPARPLRYAAFYDPWATPCYNPLLRPEARGEVGEARRPRATKPPASASHAANATPPAASPIRKAGLA